MSATDTVVIVGASLAGTHLAEQLRRRGHSGRVVLVDRSTGPVHDRPPLSKRFLSADVPDSWLLRGAGRFAELDVEFRPRTEALQLAPSGVVTSAGPIGADRVVVASGASAMVPPAWSRSGSVVSMRTVHDALGLRRLASRASSALVIGAGLIGMEVAGVLTAHGIETTVLEAGRGPLHRAVGPVASRAIWDSHARRGTNIVAGVVVRDLQELNGRALVVLDDGRRLAADLAVVALGSRPDTSWLPAELLDSRGAAICDGVGRTLRPDTFALGDSAAWVNARYGDRVASEHWTAAVEQAAVLAEELVSPGAADPWSSVPYFWSDQHECRYQVAGRIDGAEEQMRLGSVIEERWLVEYRRDGRVVAGVACNQPAEFLALRRALLSGEAPALQRQTQ